MRNALHKRFQQDNEQGFTLIELMVVVLIIGILLAIAIPTFLGARNRANNRSVQSNLRNALTAEKTLFTDNELYTDTSSTTNVSSLAAVEPALNWIAASVSPQPIASVSATVDSTKTLLILATKSATGECFYVGDVGIPLPGNVAGTFYASSNNCTNPGTGSLPTTPSTAPIAGSQTTPGGLWATAFGT